MTSRRDLKYRLLHQADLQRLNCYIQRKMEEIQNIYKITGEAVLGENKIIANNCALGIVGRGEISNVGIPSTIHLFIIGTALTFSGMVIRTIFLLFY